MVPMFIGTLRLWSGSSRSQEQKLENLVLGRTRSLHKSKGPGKAKILHRTFKLPGLCWRILWKELAYVYIWEDNMVIQA